jgi:hypothetical protein
MKINWKYCSIALFTSIGVHALIISAFFLNYVHQMSSIRSNIQQYINTNQDNITSAKNALTIAQKSEFSPELYIVIFFISFVILSIVVYFFQGFVSSKKAKK